jgi:hypothetical protein
MHRARAFAISLIFCLCAQASLASAQTYGRLPDNPFLSGSWRPMDRLPPSGGELSEVGLFPRFIFNRMMTRRDSFELEMTSLEKVTLQGAEEALRAEYEGTYVHYHAHGDYVFSTPANSPGNEIDYFTHTCAPGWVVIPVSAVTDFWLDDQGVPNGFVTVGISGATDETPAWEHSQTVRMANEPIYELGFGDVWAPYLDTEGDILYLDQVFEGEPAGNPLPTECRETIDYDNVTQFLANGGYEAELQMRWERAPVMPFEITGDILGVTGSAELDAVDGTATLYRKIDDAPAPLPDETLGEYLNAHGDAFEVVNSEEIGPDGTFAFVKVPLFETTDQGHRAAVYMLGIEGAHIEPAGLDDPVPLRATAFPNLTPEFEAPQQLRYELVPDDIFGPKRDLIKRLNSIAPKNFGPFENMMATHLDDLESGTIELTDPRREGVKRATWAERVVMEGTLQADAAIQLALDRIVKVLHFAFDFFWNAKSRNLRKSEALEGRINNLRETQGKIDAGLLPPRWRVDKLDNYLGRRKAREALATARTSRAGEMVKNILSAALNYIELGLKADGKNPQELKTIKKVLEYTLFAVFDAVANQSGWGVVGSLIKDAVDKGVKGTRGIWLDNRFEGNDVIMNWDASVDVDSVPSFGKAVAPAVQYAVDNGITHSVDNPQEYEADADRTYRHIVNLIDEGTAFDQEMIALKAAADTAEGIAGAMGLLSSFGVKQAAAVENVAKFGNVTSNAYIVYRAFSRLYDLPDEVEAGVAKAFGAQTILSHDGVAGEPVPFDESVVTDFYDAAQDYWSVTRNIMGSLRSNDLDSVFESLYEPDGEYRVALAELYRTEARMRAYFHSLPEPDPELSAELEELATITSRETTWFFDLHDLAVDLFELQFPTPDDDAWIVRRDGLAAQVMGYGNRVRIISQRLADRDWSTVDASAVVAVQRLSAVSTEFGSGSIHSAGEVFDVEATVATVGDHDAEDVEVELVANGIDGVEIEPAGPQSLGTLSAPDGDPISGDDQATLTWTVTLPEGIDPAHARVDLSLQFVEPIDTPRSWVGVGASTLLTAHPVLWDADLDGLPDDWEVANGLDATTDDAVEDPDQDGLPNAAEYMRATDPQEADTDGDGVSDGDEVLGRVRGWRTDPTSADTDGDGVGDGADGAPLNSLSTDQTTNEEPILEVAETSLELDGSETLVLVDVSNAGGGTLGWAAVSLTPGVEVSPTQPADASKLVIDLSQLELGFLHELEAEVLVYDASGADPDPTVVELTIQGVAEPNLPLPERPDDTSGPENTPSDKFPDAGPWWEDEYEPIGSPGSGFDDGEEGSDGGETDQGCCAVVDGRARHVPGWLALAAVALFIGRRRRR